MIEPMIPFAFVSGLIMGWLLLAHRRIDYLLLVFYFAHIRSQSTFEAVYANADDETTFMSYKDHDKTIGTYASYLQLHNAVQKTAYSRYRRLYRQLLRSALFYTPPAIVLLAIVFTRWWYFYLLGVCAIFTVLFTNKIIVTNHKIGYYQRLMIAAVFANYQREKEEKVK